MRRAGARLSRGISHERLDARGPAPLALPLAPSEPGERRLTRALRHPERPRPARRAARTLPPGEQPDAEFPFVLVTGRRLEHYNAGTMTRRTANLSSCPRSCSSCTPTTPASSGVGDGERVEVTSRRGDDRAHRATSPTRVSPGAGFIAFHFPEALANLLTSAARRRDHLLPRVQGDRGPSPELGMIEPASTKPPPAPAPTAASFDALLPPQIAAKATDIGAAKAGMAALPMFALAVLAGAFIALGALFATTVVAGAAGSLPFGVDAPARRARLLPRPDPGGRRRRRAVHRQQPDRDGLGRAGGSRWRGLLRNWAIVYVGNLVGALAHRRARVRWAAVRVRRRRGRRERAGDRETQVAASASARRSRSGCSATRSSASPSG